MAGNSDSFEFSVELDDLDEPSNGNGANAPQHVSRLNAQPARSQSAAEGVPRYKSELLEAELLETLRPPPSADHWSEPRAYTSAPALGSNVPSSPRATRGAHGSSVHDSSVYGSRVDGGPVVGSRVERAFDSDYQDHYAVERHAPRPMASSHRWDDVTPRNSSSDLLAPSHTPVPEVEPEPLVAQSFVVYPKPGVAPISLPSWSERAEPISSSDYDSPPAALRHGALAPGAVVSGAALSSSVLSSSVPKSIPNTIAHNTVAQSLPFSQSLDVPSTDPTGGKRLDPYDSGRHAVALRDTRPPKAAAPTARGSFERSSFEPGSFESGSFETAPPITTRGTHRAGAPTPSAAFVRAWSWACWPLFWVRSLRLLS